MFLWLGMLGAGGRYVSWVLGRAQWVVGLGAGVPAVWVGQGAVGSCAGRGGACCVGWAGCGGWLDWALGCLLCGLGRVQRVVGLGVGVPAVWVGQGAVGGWAGRRGACCVGWAGRSGWLGWARGCLLCGLGWVQGCPLCGLGRGACWKGLQGHVLLSSFQTVGGLVDYILNRKLGACARLAFRGLSC